MSHTVGPTTTDYEWDLARRLPVVLDDGTNTYVYGRDLIASIDGAGVETFFTYDGLGSTADLTDDTGAVTDTYSYDVFGDASHDSGSSDSAWLFTGEQNDGSEDLYYLRARYYDPATGRFLSQDPLGIGNGYSYVGNNPVNYVDPYGLFAHGSIIDAVGECITDPLECVEDVAEALDPVAEFLTDPETLIAIGQAIGGGAIVFGCTTGGPANPLCWAGVGLYVLVSYWEYSRAESLCARVLSAATSLLGLPPIPGQKYALTVAVMSGVGDAILCDPETAYASGSGGPGTGPDGPGPKE